ncbi:MAG: hypothetical protein OXN89_13385 [Bryobacterales bacterium]|nr:hypothetical protein [Bryobacterales bacterium]
MAHVFAHAPHPASGRETPRGLHHDAELGEPLGLEVAGRPRESLDANPESSSNRRRAIGSSVFARGRLLIGIGPSIVLRLPELLPPKPDGNRFGL